MAFTDIRTNAIFRKSSPRMLAYAQLMRLDRPIGTWLLLLPGWWAIAMCAPSRWDLFLLFGIGALVMRGAGCVINDLWDRDLDKGVERTSVRPLPSGRASVREAFGLLAVLLIIGLVILLQLGSTAIIAGVVSMAFVIAYPLMKRITWWPQLFLGLTFNFGAIIGWAAATGHIGWPAVLLYVGGIFWTLGYDTIYAHMDKDDDALMGIKSTARLLGNHSKIWISAFYTAAILLWAGAFVMAGLPVYGLALVAAHFVWQVYAWDMHDPNQSLRFFRSNRDAGLVMLAVIFLTLI